MAHPIQYERVKKALQDNNGLRISSFTDTTHTTVEMWAVRGKVLLFLVNGAGYQMYTATNPSNSIGDDIDFINAIPRL